MNPAHFVARAAVRAPSSVLWLGAGVCVSAAVAIAPMSQLVSTLSGPKGQVLIEQVATPAANASTVQPFHLDAKSPAEKARAVRCLTDAIYYEAGNQSVEGQRAIAQVVVNRVRDPHFPKSVCGVVYEGWARKTGCQFSFVCDGSITRRHAETEGWRRMRPIAEAALNGAVVAEVGTATHYYANYVKPYWLRSVAQVTAIGQHIFCSWKGRAGRPSALTGAYAGGEFAVSDDALDGRRPVDPRVSARTAVARIEHGRHLGRVHIRPVV